MAPPTTTFESVVSRLDIREDGCWYWTGSVCDGYGYVKICQERKRVHRYIYEQLMGPITDGLVTDHLCRHRLCANPEHIELVTVKQNTLRGIGITAINAVKTHCKNGHELKGLNVYLYNGKRHCRECRKQWKRNWRLAS